MSPFSHHKAVLNVFRFSETSVTVNPSFDSIYSINNLSFFMSWQTSIKKNHLASYDIANHADCLGLELVIDKNHTRIFSRWDFSIFLDTLWVHFRLSLWGLFSSLSFPSFLNYDLIYNSNGHSHNIKYICIILWNKRKNSSSLYAFSIYILQMAFMYEGSGRMLVSYTYNSPFQCTYYPLLQLFHTPRARIRIHSPPVPFPYSLHSKFLVLHCKKG